MKATNKYTIRKSGDNYALCFNGSMVEAGLFADRKTALKYKVLSEHDRNSRIAARKASTLS